MSDKYTDLVQHLSTAASKTYHQFQRFLHNLQHYQQQIDQTNDNPSPEEIVKLLEHNNLIIKNFYLATSEICTVHTEFYQINEHLKQWLTTSHPQHPSNNQDNEILKKGEEFHEL